MTINTALLVILTALAAFLYAQTRADKARREIGRLAAYGQWTQRAFEAVRAILTVKDFPPDELDTIYKVIEIIDRPSAAMSLYSIFHDDESQKSRSEMNEASRKYFDENPDADASYFEFFYSSMMAISYLDNFGDLVRPKIEGLKKGVHHSSADISDEFKKISWPAIETAVA